MNNIYKPHLAVIKEVIEESFDTKTFRLKFKDDKTHNLFTFKPGQFAEYSAFGDGESTFCISSSPTRKDFIECSFKVYGKVTQSLNRLNKGDTIGIRGPYGNSFPLDDLKGKNILFIAGGIGIAPVRCTIEYVLDNRDQYKNIIIIYGARSTGDLIYKDEVKEWIDRKDVKTIITVDPGGESPSWKGEVGFVPTVLEKTAPASENTAAILCGPPVMIKFTIPVLTGLGFKDDDIYTTLENRMKCGLGKCGRCNIGNVYVCKDGPVFTYAQIKCLPQEY
ncbi:MAG: Anaerobic sulfite reductase subunit B [Ignavibacteria bacterium]|nr:Anaerobic sulfite reductase subunit B [Ignavibacteria bacterium]